MRTRQACHQDWNIVMFSLLTNLAGVIVAGSLGPPCWGACPVRHVERFHRCRQVHRQPGQCWWQHDYS